MLSIFAILAKSVSKFGRDSIDLSLGLLLDVGVAALLPCQNGLSVLDELLSGGVGRSALHFEPGVVLELAFDVDGAGGGVVVVAELALLGDAVQGQSLALRQGIDVDGAVSEVLADVPIVIDCLLSVAEVFVSVDVLRLGVPPDSLVSVLVLSVLVDVLETLCLLSHCSIIVFL